MDRISSLKDTVLAKGPDLDVARAREKARRARLGRVAMVLAPVVLALWARMLVGRTITWGPPDLPEPELLLPIGLIVVLGIVLVVPLLGAGRSPHVRIEPEEVDVNFAQVKGMGAVTEEVTKTLNLFLAHKTFRDSLGGTPRRAVLFEGPPGTGKTYMAKAMAAEAEVPYLFVSSSAFQSMYYGQTNRKIRSYFRALRSAARAEGGAIGFIEEIDAIGSARSGMGSSTSREGISGVVNELLIQLQSFDEAPRGLRIRNALVSWLNRYLPPHRRLAKKTAPPANVLVVGATNRKDDLDPALLRPGRFDRSIYFDLPSRAGRREIIDFYLGRKAHHEELDVEARRESLAAMTFGYSPVMIEHLFDEALVWALRRGDQRLDWADVQQAKFTEELGLKQPVEYTQAERERIAAHEAGHATIAHLVGNDRKLEVLSIIKRRDALGLLAHSDLDERFTKTRSELYAMIQIALGGMVAEEQLFGEHGTGPAGDLQYATTVAAQMVGALGMGSSLLSFEAAAVSGAGNLAAKILANSDAREAAEKLLDRAKTEVVAMMAENERVLVGLRDALLERDELVGDEIDEVIESAKAPVHSLGSPVAGLEEATS